VGRHPNNKDLVLAVLQKPLDLH